MTDRDGKLCVNGCFTFLPRSAFAPHPRSPDGLNSRCRNCERERIQIRKHGMTSRQKALLAEWQGGCRICKRPEPGAKGWVVDHDHACCPEDISCENCRRGILCSWCNSALGYAADSPDRLRAMADYLESGERITEPSQFTDRWAEWHKQVRQTYEDNQLTETNSPTSETPSIATPAGGLENLDHSAEVTAVPDTTSAGSSPAGTSSRRTA